MLIAHLIPITYAPKLKYRPCSQLDMGTGSGPPEWTHGDRGFECVSLHLDILHSVCLRLPSETTRRYTQSTELMLLSWKHLYKYIHPGNTRPICANQYIMCTSPDCCTYWLAAVDSLAVYGTIVDRHYFVHPFFRAWSISQVSTIYIFLYFR